MNKGALVISLDFEMMWGALDLWTPEGYGQSNIKNVDVVISRLIDLFNRFDVKSTFATVGLLMLDGKKECDCYLTDNVPTYHNLSLSPYHNNYLHSISEENLYFAPKLVAQLESQNNVEVASHTFCHYYCWEKGQTIEQFEEDMRIAAEVGRKKGYTLKSIVFPRNQVSDEYLDICAKYGFKVYRGISPKFSSQPKNAFHLILQRMGRFIDTYIPLGEAASIKFDTIDLEKTIINIPSSRFLRPYSKRLSILEGLRLRRIKKEMIHAAKHGEMYHLWWHPHNFGANMNENFAFLTKILQCYKECREKYGMISCTMSEMADILIAK